jgi:hypothetical protein
MIRKQYFIIATIFSMCFAGSSYGADAGTVIQNNSSGDVPSVLKHVTSAYRMYSVQGFEATWNVFIKEAEIKGENHACAYNSTSYNNLNGFNIGFHAGYRELGLNIGYGNFDGIGILGTTGWNANIMLDYIHKGNYRLIGQKRYAGIELEGALINMNVVVGVKYCLETKDKPIKYLGVGLRF